MRDESQNALLKTLEEPPELRPPDPAQLRARGPAGDDRLPLPADRVRPAAAGRRRSRPLAAAGRRRSRRDRGRAPASPPATSSARACCCRSGRGRSGPRRERCAAAALEGRLAGRYLSSAGPLRRTRCRTLARAARQRRAAGEDAEAATREALEEEAEAGVKRTAREIADEAKRAARRRRTEILDLGLELTPPGSATSPPSPPAPPRSPTTATASPPSRPRPPPLTRPAPAAPPSWSRTPAAGSTSTSPRSSPWRPSSSASSTC